MKRDAVSSEILDRLPPHDLEAEMSVLGSLLLDPVQVRRDWASRSGR